MKKIEREVGGGGKEMGGKGKEKGENVKNIGRKKWKEIG